MVQKTAVTTIRTAMTILSRLISIVLRSSSLAVLYDGKDEKEDGYYTCYDGFSDHILSKTLVISVSMEFLYSVFISVV